MGSFNCNCKCKCLCTLIALIASIVIGIVTAFLQITGVIGITTTFLWIVLGVAIVYLAVLLATAPFAQRSTCKCLCSAINALLIGILGAILFSIILLAIGIVATSVTTAILSGLILVFFSLTISSAACLIKSLTSCEE